MGENCIINTRALVEHDAVIADHCHIATGAIINGGAVVGQRSFVGSNAVVLQNVVIGSGCVVGAGATEQVFDELTKGIEQGRLPHCSWEWLMRIPMTSLEKQHCVQLRWSLGEGEASCLAVARQRTWKVATDDKDARKWAVRLRVPHTGTIGILGVLITQSHLTLTKGNSWLFRMIKAGYHSPVKTLDELAGGEKG